jgi:phage FluMu protein Com
MYDFRCRKCEHLLAKEEIIFGKIEVKCKYCHSINILDYPFRAEMIEEYKNKNNQ